MDLVCILHDGRRGSKILFIANSTKWVTLSSRSVGDLEFKVTHWFALVSRGGGYNR